jgi:hypothetical protein
MWNIRLPWERTTAAHLLPVWEWLLPYCSDVEHQASMREDYCCPSSARLGGFSMTVNGSSIWGGSVRVVSLVGEWPVCIRACEIYPEVFFSFRTGGGLSFEETCLEIDKLFLRNNGCPLGLVLYKTFPNYNLIPFCLMGGCLNIMW